jgi:hypothetical protein
MKGTISLVIDVHQRIVSNLEVRREVDGHVLSFSSEGGSFIEFGHRGIVKDHGNVSGAEDFLHILADFLGYHAMQNKWEAISHEPARLHGYQVWRNLCPQTCYQVTKIGVPAPASAGHAYFDLDSILWIKGIIK